MQLFFWSLNNGEFLKNDFKVTPGQKEKNQQQQQQQKPGNGQNFLMLPFH